MPCKHCRDYRVKGEDHLLSISMPAAALFNRAMERFSEPRLCGGCGVLFCPPIEVDLFPERERTWDMGSTDDDQ
jgi:hypothetical protein